MVTNMSPVNPVRSSASRRPVAFSLVLLFAALVIALGAGAIARAQQQASPQGSAAIDAGALSQIDALIREKASRTPAQRKIASRLLYAVKMARGEALASGVTDLQVSITHAKDSNNAAIDNRVLLDVRADVSDQLQQQLRAMGIDILDASAEYGHLRLAAN